MPNDNTLAQNKDFSTVKIKKKIHRISDKSLIVIDEGLVKRLLIDEDSWCEQEPVSNGILLKIYRYEQDEQQSIPPLTGGHAD
jgi:hypothetical protein